MLKILAQKHKKILFTEASDGMLVIMISNPIRILSSLVTCSIALGLVLVDTIV